MSEIPKPHPHYRKVNSSPTVTKMKFSVDFSLNARGTIFGLIGFLLLTNPFASVQADPPAIPTINVRTFNFVDEFGDSYFIGAERVQAYSKDKIPAGWTYLYDDPGFHVEEAVPFFDKNASELSTNVDVRVGNYAILHRLDVVIDSGLPPDPSLANVPVRIFLDITPPVDPLDGSVIPTGFDPNAPFGGDPYGPYPTPPPDDPPPNVNTPPPPPDPRAEALYAFATEDEDTTLLTSTALADTPLPLEGSNPTATETAAGADGQASQCGMARYWGDLLKATLHLSDRPLSYTPAFGPSVNVVVNYESVWVDTLQGTLGTPNDTSLSNFSHGWSLNWVRYVMDVPVDVSSIRMGFGNGSTAPKFNLKQRNYNRALITLPPGMNADVVIDQTFPVLLYARPGQSRDTFARVAFNRYLHLLPDGGVEVYKGHAGMDPNKRKLFLTDYYDRNGNHVSLEWIGNELRHITDAPGQTTGKKFTLEHGSLHRVTKIIDPLGRFATFEYDDEGSLWKITDPVGIVSEFKYGANHFISKLTTPYGDSKFESAGLGDGARGLEMEDPMHGRERIEYHGWYSALPPANPGTYTPEYKRTLESHCLNTFYWNKRAMLRNGGPRLEDATVIHWLTDAEGMWPVGLPESVQVPMENRTFYRYPGQPVHGIPLTNRAGTDSQPSVIFQSAIGTRSFTWNSAGRPLSIMEPGGSLTTFTYDASGQDLLTVEGGTSAQRLRLGSYVYSNHLPVTVRGPDGFPTSLTYNGRGQTTSVLAPDGSTAQITYEEDDSAPGYGRPQSLSTTFIGTGSRTLGQVFGYDAFGRITSLTDSLDQYTVGVEYDAIGGVSTKTLDRITKITYPDSTFEKLDYLLLDAVDFFDRLGRKTHYERDPLRRVQSVTDPQQRTIMFQRLACCGSVDSLVDASNHSTHWEYDVRERVMEKKIENQVVATYQYDPASGRLKSIRDALGQVKMFSYTPAGDVGGIDYLHARNYTAPLSFSYNDPLGRLTQMDDGTGATRYGYWPVAAAGQTAAGGGQLRDITRPLEPNQGAATAIHIDYDTMGRAYRRQIGPGLANVEELHFDLGRVASVTNNLGTFTYSYDGQSDRVAAVNYPNGQRTEYAYDSSVQDFRLRQINNIAAPGVAGGILSQFGYTYDAVGRITTWSQHDAGQPTGRLWTFGYDLADQVITGSLKDLANDGLLKSLAYQYDDAGNRTKVTEDGVATLTGVNEFNQIVGGESGGWVEVRGHVTEGADVRIDGKLVEGTLDPDGGHGAFNFRAMVKAHKGTNTYRLSGVEKVSGSEIPPQTFSRTLKLEVPDSGITSYDANGNLVNNGAGQIYAWDAENRLVAIYYAGTDRRTLFSYDGLSRRIGTVEQEGKQGEWRVTVWCGDTITEERDANGVLLRCHFAQGVEELGGATPGKYYYTFDHLGSVREMTDVGGAVRSSYDYDLYGKGSLRTGDLVAPERFAALSQHQASGLQLALYRAYDAKRGRWLSRDPVEEEGGSNLYRYVENDPISNIDPDGLLTVNIWNFRGKRDAWGHASVTLDDGTHISWWPSSENRRGSAHGKGVYSAPPNDPQTYADDRRLEGDPGPPKDPDQRIPISGLDESAIKKWWDDYRKDHEWQTLSNNCSSVAYRALRAGGAPISAKFPWTPKSIASYAQKLQKRGGKKKP